MLLKRLKSKLTKSRIWRTKNQARRYIHEFLGSAKYSRPALNELDRKLERYLPYHSGVFIEAGGNDGYTQSNTYYFEKFKNWRGILVEPIPELFEKCRNERKNSEVFSYALVSSEYEGSKVTMTFSNLMSLVDGARKSIAADNSHIERGAEIQDISTYKVDVPARTLSQIIDGTNFTEIDLLSLDVEGYELQVLKGLDFSRHAPKFMLIEATFRDEIEDYILDKYEQVEFLSHHDILYRRRQL